VLVFPSIVISSVSGGAAFPGGRSKLLFRAYFCMDAVADCAGAVLIGGIDVFV